VKYFWFPAAILSMLLALSIWNAHSVEAEVDGWCRIVEEARTAATRGDLYGAGKAMAELETQWLARRRYYHALLEHDELDDAEELLARSDIALESGNADDFAVETTALIAQLRVIAEMQGFRIENIL